MIHSKNLYFAVLTLTAALFATSASAQPYSFTGRCQQATRFFNLDKGLTTFNFRHVGRSNFIVHLLDSDGHRVALVANEIGSCNGSKAVRIEHRGSYLLDISADGQWAISRSEMYYNPYVRHALVSPQEVHETIEKISDSLAAACRVLARQRFERDPPQSRTHQFEDTPSAKRLDELDAQLQRLKQRTRESSFDDTKAEWQRLRQEYWNVVNGRKLDRQT